MSFVPRHVGRDASDDLAFVQLPAVGATTPGGSAPAAAEYARQNGVT
ncbi:hypothetical protein [Mycobacterium lacus]|nr:hypothetical protein [Mycobacterium lacus]MCV7123602.1 hypothetical protein [Mycobacterium lacus]